MKRALGFLHAQGMLVLLLASQSVAIADGPRGGRSASSGHINKVAGFVNGGGGGGGGGSMKVMPRQIASPSGSQSGGNFGGTTVKKFTGGLPSGNVPIKINGPISGPLVKPRLPNTNPFPGGTVSNGGIVPKFPGGKPKFPIDPIFSGGTVKPKFPVGPILTGPVKPKLPIIDPVFPGGPVKPQVPKIPIDPGIGNGKPGNGNSHHHGNNKFCFGGWGGYGSSFCGTYPWWWHQHCWYPHWHGCYGGFNCPVIQPCPLPVYYDTVVTLPAPVVSVQTVAVEATQVDMAVMAVKVLDKGSPDRGILFRVMVGNKGTGDLTVPARLAIFAARETQTIGELPRTIVPLPPVAAGRTVELDVRFPNTANGYPMMIVAVEMPEGVKDANEQDNIAQGEIASLPGMEPDAQ